LPQAKKKSTTAIVEGNQIAHRLAESVFILMVLVAIYLVACLVSYDPTDPGPFNTVASQKVSNVGRVLGAWLANFLLFLTGYLAYLLPLVLVYAGWLVYTKIGSPAGKTGPLEWFARVTGLLLFVLSATGLAHMHTLPPAGSMVGLKSQRTSKSLTLVADPDTSWSGLCINSRRSAWPKKACRRRKPSMR